MAQVYVCRIYSSQLQLSRGVAPAEGEWCRYEMEGAWDDSNSGGCFNFPEWRKNPQFEFRTGDSTDAVWSTALSPLRGAFLAHAARP